MNWLWREIGYMNDRLVELMIIAHGSEELWSDMRGNELGCGFQEPCMKNAAWVCVAAIFPIYASSLLHGSSWGKAKRKCSTIFCFFSVFVVMLHSKVQRTFGFFSLRAFLSTWCSGLRRTENIGINTDQNPMFGIKTDQNCMFLHWRQNWLELNVLTLVSKLIRITWFYISVNTDQNLLSCTSSREKLWKSCVRGNLCH